MERFDSFEIEDLPSHWEVNAWDTDKEETASLEVTWHSLRRFTQSYYNMTREESVTHLLRCGDTETENLLKQYFLKKHGV